MTTRELRRPRLAAGPGGSDVDGAKRPSPRRSLPPVSVAPAEQKVRRPRRIVGWLSVLVLLVGLATTAVLAWTAYNINDNNEHRLLKLETKQAATVLSAAVPIIQTPLESAAGIAIRNIDGAARFRNYIATYVGLKQEPFVSASLWRVSGATARLVLAVGSAPDLAADPAAASTFLSSIKPNTAFRVTGPLGTVARARLGYAVAASAGADRYAVYAESRLPDNRKAVVAPDSAFSDLRFALYLGRSVATGMLLEANSGRLPISGRTASESIPFGGSSLLLVAAPVRPLGGSVAANLWWIVAAGGGVLSLAAAATAQGLVRRRLAAEGLTGEVQHLLGEQRSIAVALQHALLPDALPHVGGVQSATRYLPGTNGVDIGGDWYDLMPLDDSRFFFVVGDVSGRGVPAGSVMAALRFAIRAFVSEGHAPEAVLESLRGMLDVGDDHHFATVVCGIADVGRHEVTIANAGHPPLLCVASDSAEYVTTPVGVPIGVPSGHPYRSTVITVPPNATLLIYTDGLIERRGENLDEGLERLRAVAASASAKPIDAMVDTVVSELAHGGLDDDTAILGIRWLS
jgi:serine phosphatase RsbU (regulator of sigma subunit)